MELKNVQRKTYPEKKSKHVTIKCSPSDSRWMKKNNVSPSALFNVALDELKNKTE